MKRSIAITTLLTLHGLGLQACGGDDTTGAGAADAGARDGAADTSLPSQDSGGHPDGTTPDTGTGGDAADPDACPSSWTTPPTVAAPIALPADGGGPLLHTGAIGTQDYTCTQVTVDGGAAYQWVFVGPEADLADCHNAKLGTHFASDGGPTAPEWQTTDGTYVIGKKVAGFTPEGGAPSIPWLLLQAQSNGGAGALAKTSYVQRLNTTGGTVPSATCDVSNVGTTQKVSYTADYFFFGTP